MSFDSLMNRTVTLKRRTKAADGKGGFTSSWSTIYSALPIRIQPMSGREQSLYGAERVPATHKAFSPTGFSFDEHDVIFDGDDEYNILLVRDIDLMSHHQEMELRRVKPAI